jgi:hypothetical protein
MVDIFYMHQLNTKDSPDNQVLILLTISVFLMWFFLRFYKVLYITKKKTLVYQIKILHSE